MFFGFLLKFLGGGVIQSIIAARQTELSSANETRRIQVQADLNNLNFELQRRQAQRDLQLKEMEHPVLRFGKGILMIAVGTYWAGRFGAKLFGLSDFHVFIQDLSPPEETVSTIVLGYLFLGEKVNQFIKSKTNSGS